MSFSPGDRLGAYRIAALIGKGGMGEVYRATDTRMGRNVAIKLVPERFLERFDREVRAIAALNHPNICIIHDVGPNYLVMEYVHGVPLMRPVPEARALEQAEQIAAALEAAHSRGIVHRDLKPGNILVTGDRVKLLDFGLASMALPRTSEWIEKASRAAPVAGASAAHPPPDICDDDSETMPLSAALTVPGTVMGTPAYMSPEQSAGAPVDARSDVFSFGVVVYELISGRRPFEGETVAALLRAIREKEPAPLDASADVSSLVSRCLRKKPMERFQSMGEVHLAVQRAAAELAIKIPSVAVLPFTSVACEDADREYFSDGLTDDVINALSGLSGLKVIARTSTFALKGKAQDVRCIAEALGVDHVIEGSVRTAGNRIRVTVRLIAARDGAHLWSKRYDRDLGDIFLIQDEISSAIATEMKVSLTRHGLVKAPTGHFAAYEAVLQGRYHFLRFDPASQAKALSCFERALAIDPNYAAAHIGVSLFHWGQMVIGMADPRAALQIAVKAAREALLLEPGNAEGYHILASYHALHDFDWAKAEELFARAIELNPNSPWPYHCKGMYLLSPLGRLEESLEAQDRALALDPLSLPVLSMRTIALDCLHRNEELEQVVDRMNQLDPHFAGGQWHLVGLRIRQNQFEEAVNVAERLAGVAGRWGMTLCALGIAYAAAGRVEAAQGVLAELGLESNLEARAFYSAVITTALGDLNSAFQWAAVSIEHRDPFMVTFLWSSYFEGLRADPRFVSLLRMFEHSERPSESRQLETA